LADEIILYYDARSKEHQKSSTLFLTSALKGGEGSASRPGRTLPPGKTGYPLYRRLGGPQGRSGQVRKISPPPEFDPRTVQPVASHYMIELPGKNNGTSQISKYCMQNGPSGVHETGYTNINATHVTMSYFHCTNIPPLQLYQPGEENAYKSDVYKTDRVTTKQQYLLCLDRVTNTVFWAIVTTDDNAVPGSSCWLSCLFFAWRAALILIRTVFLTAVYKAHVVFVIVVLHHAASLGAVCVPVTSAA